MATVIPRVHQDRQRLTGQFMLLVAEHGRGRSVVRDDDASPVGHHDRIAGRLDQRTEAVFALRQEMFGALGFHHQVLNPDRAAERLPEFLAMVGFGQVGEGPPRQRPDRALRPRAGGDDDHGKMRVQLLDRGEHLKAVAVRQGHIEQDRVEAMGAELGERAGAGVGGMDSISVVGEQVLQADGNVRIVFRRARYRKGLLRP
jgi:hypothetical protein